MALVMAHAIANRMAKPMRSAWQNDAPNPNPNPKLSSRLRLLDRVYLSRSSSDCNARADLTLTEVER